MACGMSPRLPYTAERPRSAAYSTSVDGAASSTAVASCSARANCPHHAIGSIIRACTAARPSHMSGAKPRASSYSAIAALGAIDTVSSAARTSHPTASRSPGTAPRANWRATCCVGAPARASAWAAARCRSRRSAASMCVVHGVADEVVAKRQPVAVAGDQPGERRLPQPRGDVDDRAARHRGQVGQREARPEQAGEPQQIAGLDRKPRQATHQRLVEPARGDRRRDLGDPRVDPQETFLVERAQQLGHEQRVATGRLQPRPQLAARCRPGDRRGQRMQVDLVERAETQVAAARVDERVDHPVQHRRARRGPQRHDDAEPRRP